jgi:predicted GNAT family acetyltransferase
MEARVHQNTAEFREAAWPLLAADPVKHTVILTATARPFDGALLITLHDKGSLIGAALQTGAYPMIVTAVPAHAAEFAASAVHDLMPDLPAVSGTEEELEAFVAAWTARTGRSAKQTMATRLFKLGELRPPQSEGTAREVTEDDLPLMTEWIAGFLTETLPPPGNRAQADALAKAKFEPGEFCLFWEINGTPVAMAAGRGPISGMSRIAPVYTPPEQRGHGYASAVTAAVTQIALDRGSDQVLIFTDLANPTTNHIYPAIGYEPIGDSAEYRFT